MSFAIGEIIRNIIIPTFEEFGVSRVALAKTQFKDGEMPPAMSLTRRQLSGKPIRTRISKAGRAARWPEHHLEILRFPVLIFVYGGEADLLVGDAIVHCPAGHAILVPAGVPIGDGEGAHWYRAQPENASSDIFWLHMRTFGAEFFICHTRGTGHESGWLDQRFISANPQFFALLENCIEEMEQPRSMGIIVSASYLLTLFCLLQRHWGADASQAAHSDLPHDAVPRDRSDPLLAVRRAQQYITGHLRDPLTLENIASAAYVSRSHLAQIFREELGQTVWQYVSEQRLVEAKVLLVETDLNVSEIARLSGLSRTSHFFVRFAQLTGISPGEFRRQTRQRNTATKSKCHGR